MGFNWAQLLIKTATTVEGTLSFDKDFPVHIAKGSHITLEKDFQVAAVPLSLAGIVNVTILFVRDTLIKGLEKPIFLDFLLVY